MAEEETTTTVENVDEATIVDSPETAEETTSNEDVESEATETKAEEPEKPEKPKLTVEQKKIAKQARQIREMKRQNAQMLKLAETQAQSVSKLTQKTSEAPKIEDFESMSDYVSAELDYKLKQLDTKREASKEPEADYSPHTELSEAGTDKYEDFEEVVFAPDVRITPSMADAIFEIDDIDLQADVAYFLGQNPKEAAKISRLSERRQGMEVAKIEVKLSSRAPAKKTASKAPPPIKPVGGAKTSNNEFVEGESYKSWLQKRNKQLGR